MPSLNLNEWHAMNVHDSGNSRAVYLPAAVSKVMGAKRKKMWWRFHRGAFILRATRPGAGKNGAGGDGAEAINGNRPKKAEAVSVETLE